MAPQSPPVSFRNRDIEAQIATRAADGVSSGSVASRDLGRYYALLDRALRQVVLSEGEASLLCDAMNGVLHTEKDAHLFWAGIDDAIRLDRLDAKWGVDGAALVDKLRDLGPCAAQAIVDAVERFWRDPNRKDALRAVGLVRA